jgi:hypothetical protein
MAADTLTCPHCGNAEGKVTVESRVTLVYGGRLQAEIDIVKDITPKGDHDSNGVRIAEEGLTALGTRHNTRELINVRKDGDPYDLELGDWYGMELDDADLVAYCFSCNGDVTEQFRALLDERVPLEATV